MGTPASTTQRWSGHAGEIEEYVAHRGARERHILEALIDGLITIPHMVAKIYADVDVKLHKVAAGSVKFHMKKLARDGRVHEHVQANAPSRWELL